MKILSFGAGIVVLHHVILPSVAYIVSTDCENVNGVSKIGDVENAIEAWKTMANYAIGRASDAKSDHRQGNLLQTMLGAPNEDDEGTRTYLKEWLNKAIVASNSVHLVFTCTDKHLTTLDAQQGLYRDFTWDNGVFRVTVPRSGAPLAPGVTNACAGQSEAFTYQTNTYTVVVLCSDTEDGAMNSYDVVDAESYRGKYFPPGNIIPTTFGINIFARTLVYKIAHEMMHATNMQQFPGSLPVPNQQRVAELYKYEAITRSAVNSYDPATAPVAATLRQNADSFALLVCGWYCRACVFTNGAMVKLDHGFPPKSYPAATSNFKRVTLHKQRGRRQLENWNFNPREPLDGAMFESVHISSV